MKERDWRIFKEDFQISTRGTQIPWPLRAWDDAGPDGRPVIPAHLVRIIARIGYTAPSPIQRQAIPIGMQNRDIIGIAETGSGKTAAFVIPMLALMDRLRRPRRRPDSRGSSINHDHDIDIDIDDDDDAAATRGPYALILAPTRELAQQIEAETAKFCAPLGYRCTSIVGGHAMAEQTDALRHGCHVVIATPGRLRDCLDRRVLVLNQCTYVVMDEADRMIDMGFEPDVTAILNALPATTAKPADGPEHADARPPSTVYRQTVMFSATMPPSVERLARTYLQRPAIVTVGTAGQAVDRIVQSVEVIPSEPRKLARLARLITSRTWPGPILVFVNQKRQCDVVTSALEHEARLRVASLHGGKTQALREQALQTIRDGQRQVLVATDVAGRGIDIKDVALVVNFDVPKSIEDYTHRIGRTGRAGRAGAAVTFVTPGIDDALMPALYQMLRASPTSVMPPEFVRLASAAKGARVSRDDDLILD